MITLTLSLTLFSRNEFIDPWCGISTHGWTFGFHGFWHVRIISAVTYLVTVNVDKWILQGTEWRNRKTCKKKRKRGKSHVGISVSTEHHVSPDTYTLREVFPHLCWFALRACSLWSRSALRIEPRSADHCPGFLLSSCSIPLIVIPPYLRSVWKKIAEA